jgi:uncharacterized membrane protein
MTSKRTLAGLALVLVTAVVSIVFAPELPETMAAHWSASGTADGSMDRTTVLVGGPALVLGIVVLFELVPRIDPLGSNVGEFQSAYDAVAVLTAGFLAYTYGLVIAWNLGSEFDIIAALAPAMAVLYIGIGFLVERAERNWFVGVRTPWTLSSEQVWRDTHDLSATLFKLTGVLALGALVLPEYAISFIVVPAVTVSLVATVYSYIRYRQLGESGIEGAGS